jgi:hypothetical protein
MSITIYNAELLRPFTWGEFVKKWGVSYDGNTYNPDRFVWLDDIKTNKDKFIKDLQSVEEMDVCSMGVTDSQLLQIYILNQLERTGWDWVEYLKMYIWSQRGIEICANPLNATDIIFDFSYENYDLVRFVFRAGHDLDRLIYMMTECQKVAHNLIFKEKI